MDTIYRVSTSTPAAGETAITLDDWPGSQLSATLSENLGIGSDGTYLYIARDVDGSAFEVAKYNVDGSLVG